MTGPVGLSAPMVAALERAWADIRARHPDLPPAVVVLGSGSVGARRGELRLGHFAATRWHAGERDLHEVFVAGEGLERGPVDVLDTLLHEAAHAIAHTRSVQDTSRGGRYHNRRYVQIAEELGLVVAEVGTIGWSNTTVPEPTQAAYAGTLTALAAALTAWRRRERAPGPKSPTTPGSGTRNLLACVCRCGRKIRASRSTLAAGPILCTLCGEPFAPADRLTALSPA